MTVEGVSKMEIRKQYVSVRGRHQLSPTPRMRDRDPKAGGKETCPAACSEAVKEADTTRLCLEHVASRQETKAWFVPLCLSSALKP